MFEKPTAQCNRNDFFFYLVNVIRNLIRRSIPYGDYVKEDEKGKVQASGHKLEYTEPEVMFLRNVGKFLSYYMASHFRRR
jgi:hypothetical protein